MGVSGVGLTHMTKAQTAQEARMAELVVLSQKLVSSPYPAWLVLCYDPTYTLGACLFTLFFCLVRR